MYLVKLEEADILKKLKMKVINPFIIDGPLNVSDIEMCEFVDHLEMSKCFKNYKTLIICLQCTVALFNDLICFQIIEFPLAPSMAYIFPEK